MKRICSFFILFAFTFSISLAQEKNIDLQDIWKKGTFGQEYLEALRSLNNGNEYAILKNDRSYGSVRVEAFSYQTGEKTRTLIDSKNIQGLDYFQSYAFNNDETAAILATELESIYRHSRKGIYYVYSLTDGSLTQISDQKIKEPTFSPDGKKIAFSFENNLYVKNLENDEIWQITADGESNRIINGTTDWVYEEEFGFTRAFDWNKDSDKIGFLRFDESEVPEFTMEYYGSSPENDRYPFPYTFKYPKAGDKNSEVSLWIYDISKQKSTRIDLGKTYEYLPRIKWTNDPQLLSVQATNRHQNDLDLIFVNADNFSAKVILNNKDKAYVPITNHLTFLEDNSFIWSNDQSNWTHLYHYDKNGKQINQITSGDWDVTAYYGYDDKTKNIYYQSTENGSVNRDVYSIRINGKQKMRLSPHTGTNRADFSKNHTYFINTFNNVNTPNVYTVYETRSGKEVRLIEDNSGLKNTLKDYKIAGKELTTLSVKGNELNMWMIKPKDFDPEKEYPLFLFQYSGPGSQSVSNSFYSANDFWYEMLAENGYIVACIDGRGTGFKGADFRKITQLELGKYEVEDQIEAAKILGDRPYIDSSRMGIWGWSYGGFMSSNALFQGNDVFKMAIAVAPVTSWRFYDTVYTERYMTTPQENPGGYDRNSPITHVDKLKGNYLLVHGSGDDNVHVQNAMQMIEALIQADKDFDWLIYPDYDHGIYGGNARYHLYKKMTDFIYKNL